MADEPKAGGVKKVNKVILAALLLGGLAIGLWLAKRPAPATTQDNETTLSVVGHAFANASPIPVFDSSSLSGGHAKDFEFGKAYAVVEQTPDYLRIKLEDGTVRYVRAAHMTATGAPRWLATTPAYNKPDRELIRFWENAPRLKDFLAGANPAASRWDYEEFFDSAPQFQLRLPIVDVDSVKPTENGRPVKIVSVLLPIGRGTRQAFDSGRSSFDKKTDLYLVVDVSGSTNDFLENVMGGLAKAFAHSDQLRDRVGSIVVTTFGSSGSEKSSLVGKVAMSELERHVWHTPAALRIPSDDREPLVDGLLAMDRGIQPQGNGSSVLVVMSGADVALVSSVAGPAKPRTIDNLNLNFPRDLVAIFVQITPEPGNDLRTASQKFGAVSRSSYLGYSDLQADELVASLRRAFEQQDTNAAATNALSVMVKAAHDKNMMAILPRVLTSAANLPAQQDYAAQADWSAVRLWLVVDDLIWVEKTEPAPMR
jgi:hypothetical protein